MEYNIGPIPPITWLFREPSTLMTAVKLVKNNPDIKEIAVVGCASGEQVYSLQSLIINAARRDDVEITGFDINELALKNAREASYEPSWKTVRSKQKTILITRLLNPNFSANQSRVIIPDQYKEKTFFEYHNILEEPLRKPVPLIICSNILPYFVIDKNRYQPILDTALWNLSQSLVGHSILITEPSSSQYYRGSANQLYDFYMQHNALFKPVIQVAVPIFEFLRSENRNIRFLAEETRVYRKNT